LGAPYVRAGSAANRGNARDSRTQTGGSHLNSLVTGLLLASCEPRLAADQDQFSSVVGLREVSFNGFPVFCWKTTDDFRNAATQA